MKTIGYFDDSRGPGGTTRYLFELLRGLDRARYAPVFFAPAPRPWHEGLRALDIEVITGPALPESPAVETSAPPAPLHPAPVPPPTGLRALRAWVGWHRGLRHEIASLEALFQRRPVDLLHSNNTGEEPAPIAARRAGMTRVIGTLHVDPGYDLFGEHRTARHLDLKRRSLRALDVAIAVSRRTAEDWRKHLSLGPGDPPRMEVIPNGIAADALARRHAPAQAREALGLPADALVIGSIGRLDHAKGYGDLLAAMPSLLAAVPRARMIHAGTGPLAEALRDEAVRLGVADRIHWLGFRSDVRDLLEACDLYVQPSWCESQGLAVLEAGALDVPVVATDVGGLPESLEGGEAGWLVPARQPAALAEALRQALENPAERERRGERLARRVRTIYTREAMVHATLSCYDRLLHEAAAS